MIKHKLNGCLMTPMISYLKALGLLKILSEKDPDAVACWEDDIFVIHTEMSREGIVEFILKEYRPTPIISPWSYNKFIKTSKLIKELPDEQRFNPYRTTAKQMEDVFTKFSNLLGIKEIKKPNVEKNKSLLLKICRNDLPDEIIPWLDTICVITATKPKFAPVLGSGGNDGNFDIAENFLKKIHKVLDQEEEIAKKWIESAMYGEIVPLLKGTTIGHNPEGVGGPNSGEGFKGLPLSNPWDYILAIEGTMLFAGSVSKHLSVNIGYAAFPFTAETSNAGYVTASNEEKGTDSRGEIWLPIWKNPATYKEIRHIFNEGRIQIGRRQAKTGTDFARAVITLGTERGIEKFQRFCILKRKGLDYLAVNAGTIPVTDKESTAMLLNEIDAWYRPIIQKSGDKSSPKSLQLVRNLDESIMSFSTAREKRKSMLQILVNVAKLEQYMVNQKDGTPLQSLSEQWLAECDDNTPEFRLAASVASIQGIRKNLENIEVKNGRIVQKLGSVRCVWNPNETTISNMNNVLQRRALDGKMELLDRVPISGLIPVQLGDVFEFLHGFLDMQKLGDLIPALSLIRVTKDVKYSWKNTRDKAELLQLPEAYCTLKLVCPPDKDEKIPYDISVINHLAARRINDAYLAASRTLQSHGLQPLRYSKKSGNAKKTTMSDNVKERLMPSLLFTLSCDVRKKILRDTIAYEESNSRGHA
ncbi:MAG: type I-U CRISPR-associated protein Csx17 [Gammaproteobacteria bacterium]|nr:type I-U CRISPR-associated protein Csx17 [Gammaproteobacteria bacterium]